jgi:hypothetical protein
MASITVNGRRVTVGDEFFQLSPEDQDATVDEIAQSLGAEAPPAEAERSSSYQDAMSEMSAMTQNPARAEYDALPEWQKPLVAASDIVGQTARGAMGMVGIDSDKAAATMRSGITGGDYETELANQRRLTTAEQRRSGGAGTAAELTGAIAVPVKLAGKGITLAGRGGTAAMKGAKGLAARSLIGAPEAAVYGGLNANARDQDIGPGALIGAAGGIGGNIAGEAISGGISKAAGMFNKKPPAPTKAEILAAGSRAFNEADKAGVIFNDKAVQQLQRNVIDDLTDMAFHPSNETGAVAALASLRDIAKGNVTLKGLHSIQRMAQNGFLPGKASNNKAIGHIVRRIDELIDTADPATILASSKDPVAALAAFREGKKHWHRAKKLETVEKAVTKGEQNAAAQISGDVGRTTMGQLKNVLQSEAKTRGFTKPEMKALGSAAGYSKGQRLAHAVGGLMPRGRLLASIHGATALASGGTSVPLQAAGMALGFGAQKMAERIARKSVAELTELIANGGVPPAVVKNAMQLLSESKREALSRALMTLGIEVGNARLNAPSQ